VSTNPIDDLEVPVGYRGVVGPRDFEPDAEEAPDGHDGKANIGVRLLLATFFVFSFPAFTLQLASDPMTGRFIGSPFLAAMTFGGEIFVLAAIATSRDCRRLAATCWPILAFAALGFVSAAWSLNPRLTIEVSIRNLAAFLLGITIVGYLPGFHSVRFVIRTMLLGCVLSLVWVLAFPEAAIHQASDVVQNVHAGLWRGIFSHKQGLGLFSGLTLGFLLFYRSAIFPVPVLLAAQAVASACLIGSASATGVVATFVVFVFLLAGHAIQSAPQSRRGLLASGVVAVVLVGLLAFQFGALNFLFTNILGKSSDLTGRAISWPMAIANLNSSGSWLLGGGLGSDFAESLSPLDIDSGYIDKLIEFGYLGAAILFSVFAWIAVKSLRRIVASSAPDLPIEDAMMNLFPFAAISAVLIVNVTESNFMTKHFCTVLTSVAIAILYDRRKAPDESEAPEEAEDLWVEEPPFRGLAGGD